jgi:hypothetical protein
MIVSRFMIQCQGLQPVMSRAWKVESATTGRLLRRDSCVPAGKVIRDRRRSAFRLRRTQRTSFDYILRGLPKWAMQRRNGEEIVAHLRTTVAMRLHSAVSTTSSRLSNPLMLSFTCPSPSPRLKSGVEEGNFGGDTLESQVTSVTKVNRGPQPRAFPMSWPMATRRGCYSTRFIPDSWR